MLPWRSAALLALVLGVLGALPAAAQLRLPRPTGYVNDFAGVIPAEQEARIDAIAREVQAKSGGEIAVVTLPSLEGNPPEQVALQILREWGVGAKRDPGDPQANTGTVVMVAPRDRELRIELGYGTNTFITAGEAGRIRDTYMVPHFRRGDFGTGILQGVQAVAQQYAARYGFQLTGDAPGVGRPSAPPERRPVPVGGFNPGRLVFWIVVIFFLLSFFRGGGGGGGRRRRGYGGPIILPFPIGGGGGWGGGGFGGGGGGGFGGGGFGGFGGGSGGGGGAGGSW